MCSEWKVTSNFICGGKMYAVYRIRDITEVDHSGNREFATGYIYDKKEVTDIADKLNGGGAND